MFNDKFNDSRCQKSNCKEGWRDCVKIVHWESSFKFFDLMKVHYSLIIEAFISQLTWIRWKTIHRDFQTQGNRCCRRSHSILHHPTSYKLIIHKSSQFPLRGVFEIVSTFLGVIKLESLVPISFASTKFLFGSNLWTRFIMTTRLWKKSFCNEIFSPFQASITKDKKSVWDSC